MDGSAKRTRSPDHRRGGTHPSFYSTTSQRAGNHAFAVDPTRGNLQACIPWLTPA